MHPHTTEIYTLSLHDALPVIDAAQQLPGGRGALHRFHDQGQAQHVLGQHRLDRYPGGLGGLSQVDKGAGADVVVDGVESLGAVAVEGNDLARGFWHDDCMSVGWAAAAPGRWADCMNNYFAGSIEAVAESETPYLPLVPSVVSTRAGSPLLVGNRLASCP